MAAAHAPIVRNPYLQDPDLFVRDPEFRDHIYLDADDFATYLTAAVVAEPFAEARYADDLLRNRMLNELFHEAVPVILHEDDLNAMYYSIENRSPYLDRDARSSSARASRRGTSSATATPRRCCATPMRGIAPDAVLDNRRKVGLQRADRRPARRLRPGRPRGAAGRPPDLRPGAPRGRSRT